jgi:hypothetical protein
VERVPRSGVSVLGGGQRIIAGVQHLASVLEAEHHLQRAVRQRQRAAVKIDGTYALSRDPPFLARPQHVGGELGRGRRLAKDVEWQAAGCLCRRVAADRPTARRIGHDVARRQPVRGDGNMSRTDIVASSPVLVESSPAHAISKAAGQLLAEGHALPAMILAHDQEVAVSPFYVELRQAVRRHELAQA